MKTKMYVVIESVGFMGFRTPIQAFFSLQEAEFQKWKLNNLITSDYFMGKYYSVSEVEINSLELSGKEYSKFKKEQVEKVKKEIKELESCSEKDTKSIEELKSQLAELGKQD